MIEKINIELKDKIHIILWGFFAIVVSLPNIILFPFLIFFWWVKAVTEREFKIEKKLCNLSFSLSSISDYMMSIIEDEFLRKVFGKDICYI